MPIRPQPAHQPTAQTRRTVEAMTAYGVPEADIARAVGVTEKTLRKHYPEELALGLAKANSKVAETLYAAAGAAVSYRTDEDGRRVVSEINKAGITAAIFWLKTRAKWSERVAIVGGDKGDPPVSVVHTTDWDALPPKVRVALLEAAESLDDPDPARDR